MSYDLRPMLLCRSFSCGTAAEVPRHPPTDPGATGPVLCAVCREPMMLVGCIVIESNIEWGELATRARQGFAEVRWT